MDMNNEEIKEYLIDFQKRELPILIRRNLEIAQTNKITTIIGPRRAGKTYFLYEQMGDLIKKGIKKESIIYLNFEEPRLIGINFKEIREIIKLQWQIYPESIKNKLHIFIDEPQNIEKWEVAVRGLHDDGFKIFLTGSSSKLLSKEITTSLRGRTLSYLLLPFSFNEFTKAKKLNINTEKLSSQEKSLLLSIVDDYISFGGFPEVVLENNKETKLKILNEYLNLVVYKDIIERYNIRNSQLVKWIIKSLISSFAKEFSVNKLYLSLKSQGIKLSKTTLYSYLSMLEDSNFLFILPKFNYSIRKKEFSINKVYLSDIGFANIGENSKDIGKKMENIIFLELIKGDKDKQEISYWKNQQQEEVDFVVKENNKVKELMQVCYDIKDIETKKREIRALQKASKELKCKNLKIITGDYEAVEEEIKFIPLWKYLSNKI